MDSLVHQLQHHAVGSSVPVTQLLRECLLLASKLDVTELATWASRELDGYGSAPLPDYRIVEGDLQVFNPYRGFQPLFFHDPQDTQRLSRMHFNQSISEIERHIKDAERAKSEALHVSFTRDVESNLMKGIQFGLRPSLSICITELVRIVEAVRKIVLDWSLRLEREGILGTGMLFTAEEKTRASTVTYNIGTLVTGNVQNSQIQKDSPGAVQILEEPGIEIESLRKIISEIRASLADLGVPSNLNDELMAEVLTVESQARSPRPKPTIIREALASVRRILESGAGGVVAAGIIKQIVSLLGG